MTKLFFTAFVTVFALSGCAAMGEFMKPAVVSANERYITLRDEIGLPGMVENMASQHCAKFGRVSQFQSRGGSGWECSGAKANICTTFSCVN